MYIGECERPELKEGEILVRVEASALNRADTVQRKGRYPPPPGASAILGLECAGVVEEIGPKCDGCRVQVGDRVAGLLTGGGYGQYCTMPHSLAIPVPETLSFEQAAAIPEVWMTAYQVLFFVADIEAIRPEFVLIHAGASSVGIAATQLAKMAGSKVIITCGSQEKADFCLNQVGADYAILRNEQNFAEQVNTLTGGKGVGIIIDCVGGGYFQKNLDALSVEGRLVIIGWLSGPVVPGECNLGLILKKRIRIEGSTLRARDVAYKERLVSKISEVCVPRIVEGSFKSFVDCEFDISDIQAAHQYMEGNKNKGKIIIHNYSKM